MFGLDVHADLPSSFQIVRPHPTFFNTLNWMSIVASMNVGINTIFAANLWILQSAWLINIYLMWLKSSVLCKGNSKYEVCQLGGSVDHTASEV